MENCLTSFQRETKSEEDTDFGHKLVHAANVHYRFKIGHGHLFDSRWFGQPTDLKTV